jgi:hypothetical protein
MSSINSNVDYLRQQYNAGKGQNNKLIIQYNNKQFQDGDTLKKSDTQTEPKVQHNIPTDPEHPYFTLVNFHIYLFYLTFYYLDHS